MMSTTAITSDPRFGNHIAGVSPDGALIAYVSNRENGVDFDLWVYEVETSEHRAVYRGGTWCQPASGFSPDGSLISVLQPGPRPLDTDLLLIDWRTGEVTEILPHPEQAALVGAPAWVDPTTFFVSSNVATDHASIMRYDIVSRTAEAVPGFGAGCDAEPVTSKDGRFLVAVENDNGSSRLTLVDLETMGTTPIPLSEPGVVTTHVIPMPMFNSSGTRFVYTLSTPRLAGDLWAYEITDKSTKRLTSSPSPVDPDGLVSAETATVKSFDGQVIPVFIYRPTSTEPRPPVVLIVHGGPESQSALSFNPIVQGLAGAGYAVVVPNVRGSTGYGKRYASLDDTTLRLDSVRDLAALHAWLPTAGFDADRAALWGGSYGGYMVLAGLAFYPALWAAGVDIVGISDLVTFLENTSDYRRAHREREYGSLEHDREFLTKASPLRRADDIRAPLFVIHGRNDPRVPVSEAEQLTKSLSDRGVRCDLIVYEDEGHGLARVVNRLDAYPRAFAFLEEVLLPIR
jgi:dipeptidyl aminopeptidase/acylaminoacyl peptidase